jgi:DNA-binding MarR family transcriptional regulator/GNAT superfamily N-acetyltransferase
MTGPTTERIAAVRRFNRFYTQAIGVLHEGWLDSPFSLAEARVLYELARLGTATATDLIAALGLDAGYLSRILRAFEKRGFVSRRPSPKDKRQSLVSLTARGKKAFAPLERKTMDDITTMLATMPERDQRRLVAAMDDVQQLIGGVATKPTAASVILRPPRHGDFGWIVAAHGELYAREYGWVEPFEGLCAGIVADYVNNYDPKWEACWIAEMDGENVGSVMLVKDKPGEKSPAVARLRLLLVHPKARGLGLGRRLTDECVTFARAAGYQQVTLWTHSVLAAARHTYEKAGFTLTSSEKKKSWGKDVVAEYWDLKL